MKKQINVSYSGDFSQFLGGITLVADDVQAYEIIFSTPFDLTGAAFMITASRKDGKVVQDVGECNDSTATYTMKNAMYCVPDEVTIRLTLVKDDTMLTSKELVIPVADPTGKGTTVSIDEIAIANAALIKAQEAVNTAGEAAKNDMSNVADGTVTARLISDGAISEAHLDQSLQTKINNKADVVDILSIEDGLNSKANIDLANVTDYTVNERLINRGAVTEEKIADYAVKTNHLAGLVVTTEKINTGAVTETKLDTALQTKINNKADAIDVLALTDNLTNAKANTDLANVIDFSVTDRLINRAAVTDEKIADYAITETKIADDVVTENKLSNEFLQRITDLETKGNQNYTNIANPSESMQAWNFTNHKPVWYDGSKWIYGDGSVVA